MGMRVCVRARAEDVAEIGQQIHRPAMPTGALGAGWRQSGEMTSTDGSLCPARARL